MEGKIWQNRAFQGYSQKMEMEWGFCAICNRTVREGNGVKKMPYSRLHGKGKHSEQEDKRGQNPCPEDQMWAPEDRAEKSSNLSRKTKGFPKNLPPTMEKQRDGLLVTKERDRLE